MASRRESRSAATGAHTLQEFENLRRNFKAANDRLAKKNNELLAQMTLLNNQLQECTEENFRLRGEISTLQRNASLHQARALAFERERQTMLDLMDEVNRANEWTRKNLTSLRRSFDLVDNPESTVPTSAQKPPRARQSIPSVVGVSRQPDMSRITEGGSETQGSPRASPTLLSARPQSLTLDARPTSMLAVKARDSLSLTRSGTPVAIGRRTIRRPSGLLSALDSTSRVRSSPPPRFSSDDTSRPAHGQKLIDSTEVMPELSPLAIQLDDPAGSALHGKEKGKSRRRSLNFGAQLQPSRNPDQLDPSLNDVTNASPTGRKSTAPSMNETKETAMDGADPGILGIPPKPADERRTKKSQLSMPSFAEDLLMHGNSGDSDSTGKRHRASVATSTGSLAPPQSSSKNRSSSPADPSGKSETEVASEEEGRERRVRKSINYAEPKLNTKMRKPPGWDSKNRKSVSAAAVANPATLTQSSPPVRISTARKNTLTSSPYAVALNQQSSSPLGDVDEPHGAVSHSFTSRTRRKNLVGLEDNDGEGYSQVPHPSTSGERKGTQPVVSETSSKAVLEGQRYLNATEPGDTGSLLSSDFAPGGLVTLARKRKMPSYSSSARRAMTPADDDDERLSDDDDDGDEYVDDRPAAALNRNVVARRQNSTLGRRHL